MSTGENAAPLRWKQRFEHFEKSYRLLASVMDIDLNDLSDLEKQGYIQRLEMAFELGWKVMKDYLDFMALDIEYAAPRPVIKSAFAAGLIKDGQAWINMAQDRNLMTHTYNEDNFKTVLDRLKTTYVPALDNLYKSLKEKI